MESNKRSTGAEKMLPDFYAGAGWPTKARNALTPSVQYQNYLANLESPVEVAPAKKVINLLVTYIK